MKNNGTIVTISISTVQSYGLLVPLRIREAGREERTSPVLVNVSIEADVHAASRQQLMCFQLTDESDPFFLYSLRITEEEFQVCFMVAKRLAVELMVPPSGRES